MSRSNSITGSIDTMRDGETNEKCKVNIGTEKKVCLLTIAAVLNQIVPVSLNSS